MAGTIKIPCHGVTVVLNSETGQELAQSDTEDGLFRFKVEKNKPYYVSLNAHAEKRLGPFKAGDFVELDATESR